MYIKRLLAVALCVLASGCTTMIKVEPITNTASTAVGVVYFLPMVEYEIALTRQLTRCDSPNETTVPEPQVGIKFTAVLTTRYVQDPSKAFQIQYDALSGPTKTTNVAIELYDNGTLKSINAEAKDETRQILANVVSGLSSFALATAGKGLAPLGAPGDKGVRKPELCHLAIRNALETIGKVEDLISGLEVAIVGLKSDIQDNQKFPAKLKDLRIRLDVAEKELAGLGKQRKSVLDKLVDQQVYLLRPTISRQTLPLAPSDGLLRKWFTQEAVTEGIVVAAASASAAVEAGAAPNAIAQPVGTVSCPADDNSVKSCKPIYYRQPAEGIVRICRSTSCYDASGNPRPDIYMLHVAATTVPQLGVLSTLSFKNGPFEDNSLKLIFRPSGSLEKLEAKSKASALDASAAFKETGEALGKYRDQQHKEEVQKRNEETEKIKAEKAKLDAQLDLEKSRKALEAYRSQ